MAVALLPVKNILKLSLRHPFNSEMFFANSALTHKRQIKARLSTTHDGNSAEAATVPTGREN